MSINSLHITNGDSVLHTWKKAGLLGTHLAWRDILHEGPVPGGVPLEALSRRRKRHAQTGMLAGVPSRAHTELRPTL